MQPRSMLFTLYGVYIRHFSKEIRLGTLIKLLTEFGFSEQGIRAALKRLATQEWVQMRKAGRSNYVRMTAKGVQRVDEAANRIYRLQPQSWDGEWFLLTYTIPEEKRKLRDQLRNDLTWLGLGTLGAGVWITPHKVHTQIQALVQNYELSGYLDFFQAHHWGPPSGQELVAKCWNLKTVNSSYQQFLTRFKPAFQQAQADLAAHNLDDQQCFVQRTWLVHEYRKFLHIDPALPEQLLHEDWLGSEAFDLFKSYDKLLAEAAGRYFYQILVSEADENLATLSTKEIQYGLEAQLNPFNTK